MKYFFLTTSKGNPTPIVKDWYKKVNPRHINKENAYRLKRNYSILVQPNAEMFYPDILTDPYFMVCEEIMNVIYFYDTSIEYKAISLFDLKNQTSMIYYMPILDEIECLSEKSSFSLDKIEIKHAVLDPSKTREKVLFKLGDVKNNYFVGRLDFMESILRRGAMGFDIQSIELI